MTNGRPSNCNIQVPGQLRGLGQRFRCPPVFLAYSMRLEEPSVANVKGTKDKFRKLASETQSSAGR
jgi:hypothetical protein